MKPPKNTILKLLIFLSLMTLSACVFRTQRTQESLPVPTPETASTLQAAPSSTPAEPTTVVPALQFVPGRNDYTITVDDTKREFIVYVPAGYDPKRPTPVVLMFHGSNQSGNAMYERTGWVAQAEKENFIVVFPTSWKYLLTSSNKVEDKWYDLVMEATEPSVKFKDDVHFVKVILDQLNATFNVDKKRIFATGFSNGAYFVVTRLLVQMNDVFAAFATGGMGPSPASANEMIDTTVQINASLYKMFGTRDTLIAELLGLSVPFPFKADEIMNDPNFGPMLTRTAAQLELDSAYTQQSDANVTTLTFNQSLVGADNELIFQMIRGMPHAYPNGSNNPAGLDAAVLFWEFFMRHPAP